MVAAHAGIAVARAGADGVRAVDGGAEEVVAARVQATDVELLGVDRQIRVVGVGVDGLVCRQRQDRRGPRAGLLDCSNDEPYEAVA
jgi:hypothetical protein